MATVDPEDTAAVIEAQRSWLCERQKADPSNPILIKAIDGKMPKGADPALYKWIDHAKVWSKITTPIYTSGTLLNEILIDTDSEIWNDVRDGIRKLHIFCKENDIPHSMGFSGGKGIHYSIIFGQLTAENEESSKELFTQVEKCDVDLYKTVRRALLFEIAKRANVDLEKIGLDQKKINFGFVKSGSQVREFGTIRAPGKYKTLIAEIPDEKPEPYELPLVFPDDVKIWNIRDTEYNEIAIDALEKEIEKAKNADEYTPISDENFKDTPILKFPCIDKLFKVGIRNGRYYAAGATVLMCNKCGISKDETKKHLTTLFKTFPGITQEETDTRINNALEMHGKEHHFSCTTIKETFPEHNLCNFSQCPIKEKIALEKKGIETGQKPLTVQKETGRQLSSQARELLTTAFNKMLLSDDDNAKEKNGVGFNKFDSEAIHEEMDGKTEIPDETFIKFAPKLKKYKKQLVGFGIDTADIEGIIKEYNKKPTSVEPENVKVPFDIVAKEIMDNYHIFTTIDNRQMYIYQDGVYRNDGTEAILSTKIRDIHDQLYAEYWMSINQEFILEHIPKATTKYILEVFAYIQDYTYKSRDEIDKNADRYLNFKNGIFDIEKWELKKHTPDYLSVCQIPRIYDKKATCPQIEKFITETIDPNDEDFVFEWFGYNLTTDVSYESSLFVYGPQGTGKSLLLSLLNSFVGCNNCSAETLQNLEVKPSRVANLYGKRANICSEIPSTQIHQNEMFKKLTSGKDTVTGEHKYVRAFDFVNKAKFTFSGNKLPEEPKDPAWFARIKLISMRNVFRGTDKDDKKLLHKLVLEKELSGLLNLALKGLKRLYDNDKFSYYKTFEETEREYILYSNPVEAFVSECTVISNTDTEKDILYLEYSGWSMNKKLERLSKIEFARKLKKMGYTDYRANVPGSYCTKKVEYWCNIKIQSLLVGRDVGRDVKHRSRPNQNSQLLSNNRSNYSVGQDLSLCKSISENKIIKYENNENNANIELTYEKRGRSRPNLGFSAIGHTDPVGRDVGRDLVLETGSTDFCEKEEKGSTDFCEKEEKEGNNEKNITAKTSIEETTEVSAKSNLLVTAEEMARAWEEEGV